MAEDTSPSTLLIQIGELKRTVKDQESEIAALKKACATALSVIDGMGASMDNCSDAWSECDMPTTEYCFGGFSVYGLIGNGYDQSCVIEWPDLALARDDLRKVLP